VATIVVPHAAGCLRAPDPQHRLRPIERLDWRCVVDVEGQGVLGGAQAAASDAPALVNEPRAARADPGATCGVLSNGAADRSTFGPV
jgi:hypothetical protein